MDSAKNSHLMLSLAAGVILFVLAADETAYAKGGHGGGRSGVHGSRHSQPTRHPTRTGNVHHGSTRSRCFPDNYYYDPRTGSYYCCNSSGAYYPCEGGSPTGVPFKSETQEKLIEHSDPAEPK